MNRLLFIFLSLSFLISSCGKYIAIGESDIVTSIDNSVSVDVGETISISFARDIDSETVNESSLFVVKSQGAISSVDNKCDPSNAVASNILCSSDKSCEIVPTLEASNRYYLCITNKIKYSDENNVTGKVIGFITSSGYSITYYGNGSTEGSPPSDSNKYLEGESATVLGSSSLVKSGYTFTSWNTKQDGSGTDHTVGSQIVIPAENLKLYAKWTPNIIPTYTITYYGNGDTGGTPPLDPNNYQQGAIADVLNQNTLVKTDHSFAGWNTKSDGSGTDHAVGSQIVMPAENIELHAKWESSSCNITNFSIDGNAATIIGTDVSLELPWGTARSSLIADFITTGIEVTVGGAVQHSGVTANDFTNPLVYLIEAEDGSLCSYDVNVTTQQYSPNTVSYWKFDEGAGLVANDSVGTNNGNIINATWGIRGLDFNGTNSSVEIPDSIELRKTDQFSISIWIKTSTTGGYRYIINKWWYADPSR